MKFILFILTSLFILSCDNEKIADNEPIKSRNATNWSVVPPSTYLVTDTTYWFELKGAWSNYAGASWTTYPGTTSVSGTIQGAHITFNEGGPYQINLRLYDYSNQSTLHDGIVTTSVFEKNPTILGMDKIEKSITNSYTVNYNNVVSNYSVEWDIPNGLLHSKYGKQLNLTPTTTGTFEIKCRVIEQCPLHNESGVHVSNWCSKTITVIDAVRYDDWIVVNPVKNPSGSLSFDLRYKSSRDGYRCNAMYYVFLYQGAYDGFYASQAWEWEKALNENYYHPPVIDEEYGFVYCDWDYVNNESYISIGKDELYSKFRTISNFPSNKTIDDIEYVILFVRDNKDNVYPQYSSTCEFEYDN